MSGSGEGTGGRDRRTSWVVGPGDLPYAVEVAPGGPGRGGMDVVVTTPADPTAIARVDGVLADVGPDLGRLTLVRPAFGPDGADDTLMDTAHDLLVAGLFVSPVDPRLVLLADDRPETLRRFVVAEAVRFVLVLGDHDGARDLRRALRGHGVWVISVGADGNRRR